MTRLDDVILELTRSRANRRDLMRGVVAAGMLSPGELPSSRPGGLRRHRAQRDGGVGLGSERPFISLLAEYPYWVARRLGYFGDLATSLDVSTDATTRPLDQVVDVELDIANAIPQSSVDVGSRRGELVSIFQLGAYDPFDIVLQRGNPEGIMSARDLQGKVVVIADERWATIVDLLVAQAGGDIGAVTYDVAGASWVDVLYDGRADAALSWAGLRAQWLAGGLDFDYILGKTVSTFPANSFQIRRSDFEDAALTDLYTNYLRGWAMGMEFGHHNPRAAVQITMEAEEVSAALNATFADKAIAVASMWQLADVYRGDWPTRDGGMWGLHSVESWTTLIDTSKSIELLTDADLTAEDIVKNDYVAGANEFDRAQVRADADTYELTPEFAAVAAPEGAGSDGAYPS